jgi:hypothetical protein
VSMHIDKKACLWYNPSRLAIKSEGLLEDLTSLLYLHRIHHIGPVLLFSRLPHGRRSFFVMEGQTFKEVFVYHR